MGKELRVLMDFYLEMNEGETEGQAKQRFDKLFEPLSEVPDQKSAYQVYETEVQKY